MLNISHNELFIDFGDCSPRVHQLPDLCLVLPAPHNGLVERGGVGRDAAQTLLGDALV